MKTIRSSNQAVVLIMVLAILTILLLLGITFAWITRVERTVSRNYVDLTQAKLYAQSGMHFAFVNLIAQLEKEGLDDSFVYYGEDLNADGQLDSPLEDQNKDGILQVNNCLLGQALRPSFMKDLNNDGSLTSADLIDVKGKKVGVSSFLLSRYKARGGYFTLKIEDLSSRLYINMKDHAHLQSILETLAQECDLNKNIGTRIYNNRPYLTLGEVKSKTNLSKSEFDRLKPFITVHTWSDKKVVKPAPLSERVGSPKIGDLIYSWETLRPKKIDFPRDYSTGSYKDEGEIVGRAPINVNTAAKELLVALIANLKGFYLKEVLPTMKPRDNYSWPSISTPFQIGTVQETSPINTDEARRIAEAIISNRQATPPAAPTLSYLGTFKSWEQFNSFCDNELSFLTKAQRDVIKANFNPNTNLNDFNPDYPRLLRVDKTDLTYYTTEFCFYPTGYFNINSLGRVLGTKDNVKAEAEIKVVVKLFNVYRETTQSEFMEEVWQDGKPVQNSISSNTTGPATTANLSLQTYPELPETTYLKNADYDGYISLATIENNYVSSAFRASFSAQGLNADTGQIMMPDSNGPYKDRMIAQQDTYLSGWKPGKLFPDGVYSEADSNKSSVPMYPYKPANIENLFIVSVWIKPHFFPEETGKIRCYLSWDPKGNHSGYPTCFNLFSMIDATMSGNQRNSGTFPSYSWHGKGFFIDNSLIAANGTSTNNYGVGGTAMLNTNGQGSFQAGRWMHVGWSHQNFDNRLYINGQSFGNKYHFAYGDARGYDYNQSNNYLRLGERKRDRHLDVPADSTLDEVIVITEEDEQDPYFANASTFTALWQDGRYYRGNDGTFTSRTIDLAAEAGLPVNSPITLFFANWTEYRGYETGEMAIYNRRTTLNIVDENKDDLLGGRPLNDSRGNAVKDYNNNQLKITKPIRYQVIFSPALGLNDANIKPLIFDDITLFYYSKHELLSWAYIK